MFPTKSKKLPMSHKGRSEILGYTKANRRISSEKWHVRILKLCVGFHLCFLSYVFVSVKTPCVCLRCPKQVIDYSARRL